MHTGNTKQLGIIGLGKMGGNIALQAVEKGIYVVGKARSKKPELEKGGVTIVDDYESFVSSLEPPRVIYLSLPAGPTVDRVLEELTPFLERSDVIMDGGNSFFRDSIRREKDIFQKGLFFLDVGTSGGMEGARNGACFMVGGKENGMEIAAPVLSTLAVKDGFLHTGAPGSGHFVKLVHNGIEFGMLQAIGEGYSLLVKSGFELNYADIFRNWSHGSVIRGWLVELMEQGLREKESQEIESYVEDTGEVNWLLQEAINKEIALPVISQSVMELFRSREREGDVFRAIALMRHGFGGHPFGHDKAIEKERRIGRIEKF